MPPSEGPKVIMLGNVKNFDDPRALEGVDPNLEVLKDIESSREALSAWWNDKTGKVPQPIFIVAPE